jgi:hypothetical protein
MRKLSLILKIKINFPPTGVRGNCLLEVGGCRTRIRCTLGYNDFNNLVLPGQGVTKTCRLSLLTNSALVYKSQYGGMGGGGCRVSVNEYSCAHHVTWNPNKLWRSTSFNLCPKPWKVAKYTLINVPKNPISHPFPVWEASFCHKKVKIAVPQCTVDFYPNLKVDSLVVSPKSAKSSGCGSSAPRLNGQCHEIFDFGFFSCISLPQAPEYHIRAVSIFF